MNVQKVNNAQWIFSYMVLQVFLDDTFEKCSISFKFKEGENFNHRNTLSISRIKIWAGLRNWAKGDVLQRSLDVTHQAELYAPCLLL